MSLPEAWYTLDYDGGGAPVVTVQSGADPATVVSAPATSTPPATPTGSAAVAPATTFIAAIAIP